MALPMAEFPLLVLDLDGTLVDSLPDLRAALNRLLARRGLAPLSAAEARPMVGDGVVRLVERALAARGRAATPDDKHDFAADYAAHAMDETYPYPEVPETLARLRSEGWRFAVCTNKSEAVARKLLETLGLAAWFAAVGGGDSFAAQKPDPRHLAGTIAQAGGDPARALMAGDHANDIKAAAALGVPSIFAAWGYGAAIMGRDATARAARFAELAALAPRLLF